MTLLKDNSAHYTQLRESKQTKLSLAGLVAVFLLIHIPLFRRLGSWIGDTGKEFGVPFSLLQGDRLYIDQFWPYGPFPPLLHAELLRCFGSHTDVLLVFARLLGFAVCLATWRILRRFLSPLNALLGALAVLLVSTTAGHFAVPYSFATLWATLLALVVLDLLLLLRQHPAAKAKALPLLLLASVLLSLAGLAKISTPVVLGPSLLLTIWVCFPKRGAFCRNGIPVLLIFFLLPILLLHRLPQSGLRWDSFLLQFFGGFHSEHMKVGHLHRKLWEAMTLQSGMSLRALAQAVLCWTSILGSLSAAALCFRKRPWSARNHSPLPIIALFATLNLLQFNCTAHVPYLFPVATISLCCAVAQLEKRGNGILRQGIRLFPAVLLAGGIVVFAGRLPRLLRKEVEIHSEAVNLRFPKERGRGIRATLAFLRQHTSAECPPAILGGYDFLYPFLGYNNPLGYYYTSLEPFKWKWARRRFLKRFDEQEFDFLVTTKDESFTYGFPNQYPTAKDEIFSHIFDNYEPIDQPEFLPLVVWRRNPPDDKP